MNDDVDFNKAELLKPPSVRYTTPGKNDPYEDVVEDAKQAQRDNFEDVTFDDPKLAGGLNERAGGVLIAGETREFYVHPLDVNMIYLECPLCGSHGSIYGGNRWYTQACCYFHIQDEDISLEVERWVTEHLDTGESIDEVHAQLTASRSGRTPTRRDYVERINAILHEERTADPYRHYLETGDEGSIGTAGQERSYYANQDSILTAEEDTPHEMAAGAAEVQE